jgi:hypothetical protein
LVDDPYFAHLATGRDVPTHDRLQERELVLLPADQQRAERMPELGREPAGSVDVGRGEPGHVRVRMDITHELEPTLPVLRFEPLVAVDPQPVVAASLPAVDGDDLDLVAPDVAEAPGALFERGCQAARLDLVVRAQADHHLCRRRRRGSLPNRGRSIGPRAGARQNAS